MRTEGLSVGGYYPTPAHLLAPIAALLEVPPTGEQAWLDPCAGKGEALIGLASAVYGSELRAASLSVYAVELEQTRFVALEESCKSALSWGAFSGGLLRADAFRVSFKGEGASLLWANPPYDHDPKHGRLEERFLSRFAAALADDGVLVYLVPFYALKASAATLAREFTDLRCYRFPGADFEVYKQVVLIGRKRPSLEAPVAEWFDRVIAWSVDSDSIPELPLDGSAERTMLPAFERYRKAFTEWQKIEVDVQSLLQGIRPWEQTDRSGRVYPVLGILPEVPVSDLLDRKYPVAMPPRPAHIAAGIAAGVFNGARIDPDRAGSALPPLLVKGVFNKEYKTVAEKTNKDGDVTGLIQVQQPSLVTTVLDLRSKRYHTIVPSAEITGATTVAELTTADLLENYGSSLMGVMLQQCPVMHDPGNPEHQIELPPLARPLFSAQSDAVQASVKLLGGLGVSRAARKGKSVLVLGEIGAGKTGCALATAHAIGARRTLVMCPPHLLDSWAEQIQAVTPWARTVVLSDVADVERVAAEACSEPVIAVMSRETAKLGHSLAPAGDTCSRCGASAPLGVDFAKKRVRCDHQTVTPKNGPASIVEELALALMGTYPSDPYVQQVCRSRALRAHLARIEKLPPSTDWDAVSRKLGRITAAAVNLLSEFDLHDAVLLLHMADPVKDRIIGSAARLFELSKTDLSWYGDGEKLRVLARNLLHLLPAGSELQTAAADSLKYSVVQEVQPYGGDAWRLWELTVRRLGGEVLPLAGWEAAPFRVTEGTLFRGEDAAGDRKLVSKALGKMVAVAKFSRSAECGEPLYQAIPEPRRYPLATYIARRHPRLFDFLVIDECHEVCNDGAAQERAAHRLTGLGLPTMMLTGTVMNGYAESLYTNMWALSPSFRSEFDRGDAQKFIDRYGYRKRLVQDRERDTGDVVTYGSMTDRVERSERVIGNAPGVLPLFLLKHLLGMSVTIHKADLAVDIPKCIQTVVPITANDALLKRYKTLERILVERIKKDRFVPGLAGKLWGQMAELPSYLDRAMSDTGNTDSGRYEIRYPEAAGGELLTSIEPFSADELTEKESWMLDKIESELAEGRNVMVFAWHTILLPRLARLIEARIGEKCPILHPDKVPTKKRQAWITKEIVEKRRRVLVVNPVAVQTGLNNLVYFSTELWMESPGCNATTYRQACGRVDRIGQKLETRIFFPVYADTSQKALHELLMRKVAVALSTDGLDAESALQAAGAGEGAGFSGFAIGEQLYRLITESSNARRQPGRGSLQTSLNQAIS